MAHFDKLSFYSRGNLYKSKIKEKKYRKKKRKHNILLLSLILLRLS